MRYLSEKYNGKSALILGVVLAVVFFSFFGVLSCGFTDWDDDTLLTDNEDIRHLSLESIRIIFSSIYVKTYVPLTVFSFACEYALFRYNPFIYHLNNLLLHMAVCGLIFLFARRLGLSRKAAGMAALLFGIHPMHVESVAWISERKDVLYSFFYMLSVCSYLKYIKASNRKSYAFTIVWGFLSILSKPMALSLPLIFFVCDWAMDRKISRKTFWDKLPHCLYIVPIAGITYFVNARMPAFNLFEAILTWVWTFSFYLKKFFLPLSFHPLYKLPSPVSLANLEYVIAFLILWIFILLIIRFRKNKWFIFGGLYYFLSIFFLLRFDAKEDLGIVADRFMYLPSLGFCIFLGVAADNFFQKIQKYKKEFIILSYCCFFSCIFFLTQKTYLQVNVWKDKASLWESLIHSFPDKAAGYNNMGIGYAERGDLNMALVFYSHALKADPGHAKTYVNRGNIYLAQKEYSQAEQDYSQAIAMQPDLAAGYFNRGFLYGIQKNYDLAILDYTQTLKLDPSYLKAYLRRGDIYAMKKQYKKATDDYTKGIDLNPKMSNAYYQRGIFYSELKKYNLAVSDFNRALKGMPKNVNIYVRRGNIYGMKGKFDLAIKDFDEALKIAPQNSRLYNDRGVIYAMQGKYDLALKDYNKAIAINPKLASVYFTRAIIFESQRQYQKALSDLLQAQSLGYEGLDEYIQELKK